MRRRAWESGGGLGESGGGRCTGVCWHSHRPPVSPIFSPSVVVPALMGLIGRLNWWPTKVPSPLPVRCNVMRAGLAPLALRRAPSLLTLLLSLCLKEHRVLRARLGGGALQPGPCPSRIAVHSDKPAGPCIFHTILLACPCQTPWACTIGTGFLFNRNNKWNNTAGRRMRRLRVHRASFRLGAMRCRSAQHAACLARHDSADEFCDGGSGQGKGGQRGAERTQRRNAARCTWSGARAPPPTFVVHRARRVDGNVGEQRVDLVVGQLLAQRGQHMPKLCRKREGGEGG